MPLLARNKSVCNVCSNDIEIGHSVRPFQVGEKHVWVHADCVDQNDERICICKHLLKKGICIYRETCCFRHPIEGVVPENVERARRGTWRRRKVYNQGKVGAFRRWLVSVFGVEYLCKGSGVLDIAGGKGEVSFELENLNGVPCTIIDPREVNLSRFVKKLERGFYHRNSVLDSFNNQDIRGELRFPKHIRSYFHMESIYDLCSPCANPEKTCVQEEANDFCYPFFASSSDVFDDSCSRAEHTQWTTKGLQDDEDSETAETMDNTHVLQPIHDYEEARNIVRNCSVLVGMHPDQVRKLSLSLSR